MQEVKDRLLSLTSRKFLLTVAFAVLVLVNRQAGLGLTEEDLKTMFIAVATYTGIEGARDAVEAYKTPQEPVEFKATDKI